MRRKKYTQLKQSKQVSHTKSREKKAQNPPGTHTAEEGKKNKLICEQKRTGRRHEWVTKNTCTYYKKVYTQNNVFVFFHFIRIMYTFVI